MNIPAIPVARWKTSGLVLIALLGLAGPASAEPLTTARLASLPALQPATEVMPTGRVVQVELVLSEFEWEVRPGQKLPAIGFNGAVPGPVIRATEGDTLEIVLVNRSGQVTSLHPHGMHLPYEMDGVPGITQPAVEPGETFVYRFVASHAGTYMYHPHAAGTDAHQIDRGAYGFIVIDPQDSRREPTYDREYTLMLGSWQGGTAAAASGGDEGQGGMSMGMPMMPGAAEPAPAMSMAYDLWTINGKAFPDTEPLWVRQGDLVRIRLANMSTSDIHPMHLHGQDFRVIAIDGHPVASPQIMNTVALMPGQIVDLDFVADNPGLWAFHCHEVHHAEGGLMTVVAYAGFEWPPAFKEEERDGQPASPAADPHGH
jgi:FtsP/CotA-like multicopper oxidase with cupredoxin domain